LIYGKITISLTYKTEKNLRNYIAVNYPEQSLGKLSEVVETSVKEYLEKQKDGLGSNQVFYSDA
jgi:hypothetical protein